MIVSDMKIGDKFLMDKLGEVELIQYMGMDKYLVNSPKVFGLVYGYMKIKKIK